MLRARDWRCVAGDPESLSRPMLLVRAWLKISVRDGLRVPSASNCGRLSFAFDARESKSSWPSPIQTPTGSGRGHHTKVMVFG